MQANSPPREAMWTIARIAERDGVSRPTVSNHVARLVKHHRLYVERDGRSRVALVNVAAYDALRERYHDPSKVQAPRPAAPAALPLVAPSSPAPARADSRDEADRQRAWIEMERRRLSLQEELGQLLRADRVAEAVAGSVAKIALILDAMPQEADTVAAALDFDDVHRVRLALRALANRTRTAMAKEFAALEAVAPATDPPISADEAS